MSRAPVNHHHLHSECVELELFPEALAHLLHDQGDRHDEPYGELRPLEEGGVAQPLVGVVDHLPAVRGLWWVGREGMANRQLLVREKPRCRAFWLRCVRTDRHGPGTVRKTGESEEKCGVICGFSRAPEVLRLPVGDDVELPCGGSGAGPEEGGSAGERKEREEACSARACGGCGGGGGWMRVGPRRTQRGAPWVERLLPNDEP